MKNLLIFVLILCVNFISYGQDPSCSDEDEHFLKDHNDSFIEAINDLKSCINNGSKGHNLVITKICTVNSSIDIPEGVTLRITQGGMLVIPNGVQLRINGCIEAGFYKIFECNGTITGHIKVKELYPQWWGTKTDDSTYDNSVPINAAINAAINFSVQEGTYGTAQVFLPSGKYYISNPIILKNSTTLTGIRACEDGSHLGSRITTKDDINILQIGDEDNVASNVTIEKLVIRGLIEGNYIPDSAVGISNYSGQNFVIRDVSVSRCKYGYLTPLRASGKTNWQGKRLIENCIFSNNGTGVKLSGYTTQHKFLHCEYNENENYGFLIDSENAITFNANNIQLDGGMIEGNKGYGIFINRAGDGDHAGIKINDIWFEGNDTSAIALKSNYNQEYFFGITIKNCKFTEPKPCLEIIQEKGTIHGIEFDVASCTFWIGGIENLLKLDYQDPKKIGLTLGPRYLIQLTRDQIIAGGDTYFSFSGANTPWYFNIPYTNGHKEYLFYEGISFLYDYVVNSGDLEFTIMNLSNLDGDPDNEIFITRDQVTMRKVVPEKYFSRMDWWGHRVGCKLRTTSNFNPANGRGTVCMIVQRVMFNSYYNN